MLKHPNSKADCQTGFKKASSDGLIYTFYNSATSTNRSKVAHWWGDVQGAMEHVTSGLDFVWGGQGLPNEATVSELRTEGDTALLSLTDLTSQKSTPQKSPRIVTAMLCVIKKTWTWTECLLTGD